ncbi:MAG: hypothetical protein LBD33_01185 [Puniceicoccales bacterium]|jgi:hypothetical protein|nr:hypothetical protein [Puniceicoccales bacterium]
MVKNESAGEKETPRGKFHHFIRKYAIKIFASSKSYGIGYRGAKFSGEGGDGTRMDGAKG